MTSIANAMEAIDWVGRMAATLNIRVANMSFNYCVDDDGTSAIAQQVNALAALGVVPVNSHGNASNCGVAPRDQDEPRLVGGVSVETSVPVPCRTWVEVVDRHHRPIAGASVRIGREKGQTDDQGVVALTVLPYVETQAEVEGRGGGASARVRPLCGAGRMRLILDGKRLEVVTDNLRWSDLGVKPRK